MNRLRLPGRMRFLLVLVAACLPTGITPGYAQGVWSQNAMVSATLGVNDGRLCLGESSRGDIGCPTYAPYVSSGGLVGIGTSEPSNTLTIYRAANQQNNIEIRADRSSAYTRAGGIIFNRFLWDPSGEAAAIDFYRGSSLSQGEIVFRTNPGASVGVSATERMRLTEYGYLGIRNSYPSTSLHVSGTIRLANGGEACDANRTGAIRYTNGDFEFCRNGTAWQTLANVADSATPDRITSGTTTLVVTSNTGFISLTQGATNTGWFDPQRGLVTLGVSSTGAISGTAGYFAGNVGIKTSDPSYTLHIVGNFAINATNGQSNGLQTASNGNFQFHRNGIGNNQIPLMIDDDTGYVAVGMDGATPSATLDISGTVKVAGTGAESCTLSTLGQIRLNPTSGKFEVCRR